MPGIGGTAPPREARYGNDGSNSIHFRLWQLSLTLLTVLITAWLITLGPIPGVIAVVTAKHVLVAILVMGLGVDAPSPRTSDAGSWGATDVRGWSG
jgi:hypothetical protein